MFDNLIESRRTKNRRRGFGLSAMSLVIHGSNAVWPSLVALFLIFVPSQLWAYLSGIWVLAMLRNALVTR